MYTVKGLLDKDGQSAILETGKDWDDTLEKAEHLRKQGLDVELFDANGMKLAKPWDKAMRLV